MALRAYCSSKRSVWVCLGLSGLLQRRDIAVQTARVINHVRAVTVVLEDSE